MVQSLCSSVMIGVHSVVVEGNQIVRVGRLVSRIRDDGKLLLRAEPSQFISDERVYLAE
jgi:hypothetical protein